MQPDNADRFIDHNRPVLILADPHAHSSSLARGSLPERLLAKWTPQKRKPLPAGTSQPLLEHLRIRSTTVVRLEVGVAPFSEVRLAELMDG